MNALTAFIIFSILRLSSVFIVQTFFVPDEYWQSLEVAHRIVFGIGYQTWEWKVGIRSYIYPVFIAGIYKVLQLLNLDTVNLLVMLPRVAQALLSVVADYRLWVWCGKRKWALFLISIEYFWFYTASRTLINTLETSLTVIGLSYYPWENETSMYLIFATLCCFIRPTAAIIWIPLILYHMTKSKISILRLLLTRIIIIAAIVCSICIAIDSYFYGRFIITPIEFVKHNFFEGIGSFYGTHSWHWYFTTGLPTVLGINTIPFLLATVETIRNHKIYPIRKCLLAIIFLNLVILSVIEHKEFRFLLCLVPMCLYIISDSISRWSRKASKILIWFVSIALLIGNLTPAYYLSVIHQKGPIDTIYQLSIIAGEYVGENNQRANILFLMPCHSTPFYSHIHQNVTMRFLKCEPNLEKKPNYIDEADQFYKSQEQWLRSHLPVYPKSALPSHVVLFETLSPKIGEFLLNYDLIHTIPHADYVNDRTGKNILIYQKYEDKKKDEGFNEFNTEKQQKETSKLEDPIYEN